MDENKKRNENASVILMMKMLYKITDKLNTDKNDIYITKHTWNAFFETELE